MNAPDHSSRVIAETFNQRAPNYGKGAWHRLYAQRLVELAALEPRQSVLDAGAGTGFAAVAIAHAVGPAGRVVAIDISPGMLAEARTAIDAAGITNVDVAQADATNLPQFDASTFDAVICAAALLYMPVASALEEWHRILKPGGLVGFSTMCEGSPKAGQLFRECAREFGVDGLEDPSAALGSDDRCRTALTAAGFRDLVVIAEHIDFSAADLERAWDSNSRSASHTAVRALSDVDLDALRARYESALSVRLAADAAFARAEVLYAFGRK